MDKFYAIVVTENCKFTKLWTSNEGVEIILKERPNWRVYRSVTNQEAMMSNNTLVWKDVDSTDSIETLIQSA